DRLDAAQFIEQGVEVGPGGGQGRVFQGLDLAGDGVAGGVDVHLRGASEEPADGFDEAAGQVFVEPFGGDLAEHGQSDGQADGGVGVLGQVLAQLIEGAEAGDQDVEAQGAEDVGAGEEIVVSLDG